MTVTDLKAHALAYATVGLEVFPLNANKTPRTTNGMKDATTDPATIETWWTAHPDALIGCRIPPDVVVIDVDPKHNGMATWKALRSTYGDPPAGRTHRSGRGDGGGHLWFRRPPGRLSVRNLTRWAKEHGTGQPAGKHSWVSGIDLLHHGHRYSVLPPSPHASTGNPYTWAPNRGIDTPPAEVPGWLVALITEAPTPPAPPAPRLARAELDSVADWFSANTGFADLLVGEGWTLVHGNGDNDGSLWRHPNATAPHSASVKNGCLFVYTPNTDFDVTEEGQPHGYTPFKAYATLEHRGNQSDAARAARRMKDGWNGNGSSTDWSWVSLTTGAGTEDNPADSAPPDATNSGLTPIHWPAFWKRDHSTEDWLIEPVVPRGRQVALWATHKTGKSLITLEMAAAAATGRPCLGNNPQPLIDVIYLDFEMTEDDLHERLDTLGYGPDTTLDHLHYYLLPALPPLDSEPGAATLLELVVHHHAQLVVLDTMSRVVTGEENSADTYRAFYRHTGTRLKAINVSLLRLDHGGKNLDQGQRGSSAKGDDVDLIWQLTATDQGLELTRRASRISWAPQKISLRRHDENDDLHHTISLLGGWPAGTKDMADQLDKLAVPITATRRQARTVLTDHQLTVRNETLGAALKYRRQRPPEGLIQT